MIKHLVMLSDKSAPSFCYYTHEHTDDTESGLLSKDRSEAVLRFAEANRLGINVIRGNRGSDAGDVFDSIPNATSYVSISSPHIFDSDIVVVDDDHADSIRTLSNCASRNVILRLGKRGISKLSDMVESLLYKCKRINLILLGLDTYKEDDLRAYKEQLVTVTDLIARTYKIGNPIELSFLTDRVLLTGMNNCNAGTDHITVAPNGKFYICPGFYYDDENNSIGDIETGPDIPNAQLLDIDHAPICSVCDAFHCKRCVYLNRKTTLEINTPSYEQCATSHIERDFSRELVLSVGDIEPFRSAPEIEKLEYIDPLLLLMGKVKNPGKKGSQLGQSQKAKPASLNAQKDDIDKDSVRSLLSQILATQKELLALLKNRL